MNRINSVLSKALFISVLSVGTFCFTTAQAETLGSHPAIEIAHGGHDGGGHGGGHHGGWGGGGHHGDWGHHGGWDHDGWGGGYYGGWNGGYYGSPNYYYYPDGNSYYYSDPYYNDGGGISVQFGF